MLQKSGRALLWFFEHTDLWLVSRFRGYSNRLELHPFTWPIYDCIYIYTLILARKAKHPPFPRGTEGGKSGRQVAWQENRKSWSCTTPVNLESFTCQIYWKQPPFLRKRPFFRARKEGGKSARARKGRRRARKERGRARKERGRGRKESGRARKGRRRAQKERGKSAEERGKSAEERGKSAEERGKSAERAQKERGTARTDTISSWPPPRSLSLRHGSLNCFLYWNVIAFYWTAFYLRKDDGLFIPWNKIGDRKSLPPSVPPTFARCRVPEISQIIIKS